MSALLSICEYGSDSEESDIDLNNSNIKRVKLPAPNLSKVPVVQVEEEHEDNPLLHGGRIRTFSHVRGNWASFVYVKYDAVDELGELINKLIDIITTRVGTCELCDDFHISLSKTFVLKYHLIKPFTSSLQTVIADIESFELGFASVKVYCNEECTRTFISLEVDPFAHKFLLQVTKKVDQVLEDFQLPTFYEEPSFHMSILWVNGNKKLELIDIFDNLYETLNHEINKLPASVPVNTVNCRSGKKQFQYSLC